VCVSMCVCVCVCRRNDVVHGEIRVCVSMHGYMYVSLCK
jgi:hypothetical protein